MTTTALATRDLLQGEQFLNAIAAILPRHVTPERMARVAIAAINRTPALAKCNQSSFFECMMQLSQWGLEPDGRHAHLIPYGDKCTLIIDYKGLVQLMLRTGKVASIHADSVCENDHFDYDCGVVNSHKIDFRKDRGTAYAYYCVVTMKDGTKKCEVMTLAEVEAIKNRSRAGKSGPWISDFGEMAKKTVFRRASKWVELSAEIREAFEVDDAQYNAPERASRNESLAAVLESPETVDAEDSETTQQG